MLGLSKSTQKLISLLFAKSVIKAATEIIINDCGSNLPFCSGYNPKDIERIRFAAIKLSGGQLDKLQDAIKIAKTDWRDLLLSAGFASDDRAHIKWADRILNIT